VHRGANGWTACTTVVSSSRNRCAGSVIAANSASLSSPWLRAHSASAAVISSSRLRLWGRDERPMFPDDGTSCRAEAYYPPRNGSRFMINIIPSGEIVPPPDLDTAVAMAEMERQMPGAIATMDPDVPGMHTTDSIDYVLVVSGEVTLELDDGKQTVLRAGDVVIQNGTRHAWRNHGTESCTIVGVAIGADRARPTSP